MSMPRTVKEILAHADELAERFENYEPSPDDELDPAVVALLRAAAGALALDDVDLALARIFALAVGELAGKRRQVEHALAHDLARLARRFACFGRHRHLLDDLAAHLRVLFQEARNAGLSWSAIGGFVGTTGEAARQRYSGKVA